MGGVGVIEPFYYAAACQGERDAMRVVKDRCRVAVQLAVPLVDLDDLGVRHHPDQSRVV